MMASHTCAAMSRKVEEEPESVSDVGEYVRQMDSRSLLLSDTTSLDGKGRNALGACDSKPLATDPSPSEGDGSPEEMVGLRSPGAFFELIARERTLAGAAAAGALLCVAAATAAVAPA